jgi:hypothetical protein
MTTPNSTPASERPSHANPDPLRYPSAYANLLKIFHKLGGTLDIQLQSTSEVAAMKHRLYSYFRALRKTSGFEDLAAIADSIALHQKDTILQLVPKEGTWDAHAITKALEAIGPVQELEPPAPVSPEARAAMLQKLSELRAKNS